MVAIVQSNAIFLFYETAIMPFILEDHINNFFFFSPGNTNFGFFFHASYVIIATTFYATLNIDKLPVTVNATYEQNNH